MHCFWNLGCKRTKNKPPTFAAQKIQNLRRYLPCLNTIPISYLDKWLEDKKIDLKTSTYEGYSYRVKRINDYFSPKQMKLIDITPSDLDLFFKYSSSMAKPTKKHARRSL